MSKKGEKNQSERREAVRGEVMKGVEEIRSGKGIVYNSAEELEKDIINRGKARKANKIDSKSDNRSVANTDLDEILLPVRQEFEESEVSEDELDAFMNSVREKAYQDRQRKN